MPTSRTTWIASLLALSLLLFACGREAAPAAATLSYVAEATTSTSVKVTFSQAVDAGTETAGNYTIRHAGGAIDVRSAMQTSETTVLLATALLQDSVSYTLDVTGVRPAAGGALTATASAFGGTSERAPIVASAIALSTTEVLVTFATPPPGQAAAMSDSALNAAFYDIVEADPTLDKTPDLTIVSIVFAEDLSGNVDRGRVILTTEEQTDTAYTIRVTNLVTEAGDKLLDPTNNVAEFRGIPAIDAVSPTVVAAAAVSNTEVLVDFSEPVIGADAADRYSIVASDGSSLEVVGAAYANAYDTQVLLTTVPQRDELTTYTVTVTGVTDRQGNAIDDAANSADFQGIFRTGPIDGDTTPPRVANTGSASNTEVLVTFTEPIEQSSAENPAHYRITASLPDGSLQAQAMLTVTGAERSPDRTTVILTTLAQTDLLYTLEVTNVTDLAGNQIAPPELLNDPSTVTFTGTPPSGTQLDTDEDGLSDSAEQRGWFVTVVNTDGTSFRYEVTSDPTLEDSDGDGLSDFDERVYATDPRNEDTDGDGIDDWRELNRIYSEPAQQDTDRDGLGDGLEVDFFGTSALFADTDGDLLLDGVEVITQNRDPLIADLPAFDMRVVGDVQLGLDVRFTAENADGSRFLETRSSQSSLTNDSSRTSGSTNANATEWFINAGAKAGVSYSPPFDFTFTGEVSVNGGYKEGTTTSFTSGSVRSTQQAQAASLATEREVNQGETVTREVVGASMAVALELVSLEDIAFTVQNLEITAKLIDPRDPTNFIPIATLTSSGSQSINLGPAPDARGPFRFTATNPPPALIEALRENPRNLLFEVANYDIVDEFGRNFTYTYQDVNDRTATLFIDYGGRRASELYRVATHSDFDEFGDPIGITLATVFEEIVGLAYVAADVDDPLVDGCLNGSSFVAGCSSEDRAQILGSYSTRDGSIHRIRNVVVNDGGFQWFGEIELPLSALEPSDVRDAPVTSGRALRFLYGQDVDGDGLTVQQEAFYGSVDSPADDLRNACFGDPTATSCTGSDGIMDSVDTDRDGLRDDEEVFGARVGGGYQPWLIVVRGQDAVETSSSPARFDTDGDGLTDCQELGRCEIYVHVFDSDASATPSDAQVTVRDALILDPQSGPVVGLYRDATGRPTVLLGGAAWTLDLFDDPGNSEALTDPSRFDSDADGLGDATELLGARYLPLDAQVGDLPLQLYPGYGSTRFTSLAAKATDPLNADSDFDLLGDGVEVQIGIDPTDPASTADAALDNDGDGLRNIEEAFGWVVVLRNAAGTWVDADGVALRADGDRLLDTNGNLIPIDGFGNPVSTAEVRRSDGSNPARVPSDPDRADADFDGLSDGEERDLFSHPNRFDTDGDGLGDGDEADGVSFPSDVVDPVRFTNPLAFDSDDDGRSDGDEALVSWVVAVRGETPYRVFSDPLVHDADLDGLSDAVELNELTDPGNVDTDGDGVQDDDDINYTVVATGEVLSRSPLVPDQVVEFRYANATVLDSCYLIGGEASFDAWSIARVSWIADLRYSPFGGNPDGYLWLRAGNFGSGPNQLILIAPDKFRGDQSAFFGGTFRFDLREFQRDTDQTTWTPNVRLVGNGLTLTYASDEHTSTAWSTVTVPFSITEDDDGITNWQNGGSNVTEAQLQSVLADLTTVQIYGPYSAPERFLEFLYGGVGFDNPTFAATGQEPIVSDFDDGALQAGNFRGKLNLEVPLADGSLEVREGIVNLGADLIDVPSGATRALTPAVQTFVLGRDQSLRAFSTTILEESEDYTLGIDVTAVADYGNFSQRYAYPVIGGSDSITLRGELPDKESDSCELALSWTWRTLE